MPLGKAVFFEKKRKEKKILFHCMRATIQPKKKIFFEKCFGPKQPRIM